MRKAPTKVAEVAERSSQRKSVNKADENGCAKFCSTRLARNGPWKEFDVREIRTKTLNRANETAIRRVRTPVSGTEYANVPIKWMTNVRRQITVSCESMGVVLEGREGRRDQANCPTAA